MMISIIVATYNVESCIGRCLDSILKQIYQNWECIIVDGLSKDRTIDIVRDYCKRDSRFSYLSEKDNGIYNAFNKGWNLAKGDWIYYLGADDTLSKDGFWLVFDKNKQYENVDLIGCGVNLIRNNTFYKCQYSKGISGCHQSFLVRKEVINELSGFNEKYKILADRDFLIRVQAESHFVIRNIHVLLANFSLGGRSQSLSYLNTVTKERYNIYKNNKYVRFPLFFCAIIYLKTIASRLKWAFFDLYENSISKL